MTVERLFNLQHDLPTLQAFLAEMRQQVSQAAYYQWGDLLWRIYYEANAFDPAKDLRVWQRADGRVDGFVHYLAPDDNPEFFLRPEHMNGPIADAMIAWAMARGRAVGASSIETSCTEGDAVKAAWLARAGFRQRTDALVFMQRTLDAPIEAIPLPRDDAIVSGADRPDLPGFTGVPCTPEAYAAVRNAPGYLDDLGLRVCHREQEIVAGCICWYDARDRCGLFEPVGTAENHRGRGLALAVMAAAMTALQAHGAEQVYVRPDQDNVPAVRLYEKLGFAVTHLDVGWALPL